MGGLLKPDNHLLSSTYDPLDFGAFINIITLLDRGNYEAFVYTCTCQIHYAK